MSLNRQLTALAINRKTYNDIRDFSQVDVQGQISNSLLDSEVACSVPSGEQVNDLFPRQSDFSSITSTVIKAHVQNSTSLSDAGGVSSVPSGVQVNDMFPGQPDFTFYNSDANNPVSQVAEPMEVALKRIIEKTFEDKFLEMKEKEFVCPSPGKCICCKYWLSRGAQRGRGGQGRRGRGSHGQRGYWKGRRDQSW
ncbi:hypothetical protein Bhyg_07558 [Pseudolycoriella hygida]|uniref:Uncharacterized protein n=1 Tax=Pseudolycoriella hygida TaxID=35572 RepID=A0A9Q0N301_9DIPT|nr:hypothetical protein Bhyg_07558 [Pseudolycoriella hygida]